MSRNRENANTIGHDDVLSTFSGNVESRLLESTHGLPMWNARMRTTVTLRPRLRGHQLRLEEDRLRQKDTLG